jgi:hypothetical protein
MVDASTKGRLVASKQRKANISAALKGRTFTTARKKTLSMAHIGKRLSQKHADAIRRSRTIKGFKEKMSDSITKKWKDGKYRSKMLKTRRSEEYREKLRQAWVKRRERAS